MCENRPGPGCSGAGGGRGCGEVGSSSAHSSQIQNCQGRALLPAVKPEGDDKVAALTR